MFLCMLLFLSGAYNVREHPRYEKIRQMYIQALKKHPDAKLCKMGNPAYIFYCYFETPEPYFVPVEKKLIKEEGIYNGEITSEDEFYKYVYELDKKDTIVNALSPFADFSDIVQGKIIRFFEDTIQECALVDCNYLLKVDTVFYGRVKKGDIIKIKFYGGTGRFFYATPGGPDYSFMPGDTILAFLAGFGSCWKVAGKHNFDIGYRLPVFIADGPGAMYKISTTEVRIDWKHHRVIERKIPKSILATIYTGDGKGIPVSIPYKKGIKGLTKLLDYVKHYQELWFNGVNDEIMDSLVLDDSLAPYRLTDTYILYRYNIIKEGE